MYLYVASFRNVGAHSSYNRLKAASLAGSMLPLLCLDSLRLCGRVSVNIGKHIVTLSIAKILALPKLKHKNSKPRFDYSIKDGMIFWRPIALNTYMTTSSKTSSTRPLLLNCARTSSIMLLLSTPALSKPKSSIPLVSCSLSVSLVILQLALPLHANLPLMLTERSHPIANIPAGDPTSAVWNDSATSSYLPPTHHNFFSLRPGRIKPLDRPSGKYLCFPVDRDVLDLVPEATVGPRIKRY
jgi:hypothetical protein